MTAQPHDAQLQRDLARFGSALAKERTKLGWTQEQAAVECGLSRSYYAGVEGGKRNVSIRSLLRICRTLKVNPGELLDPLV